jgi:integrase
MPRTATIPIPIAKREEFFVAIWDLAWCGCFFRAKLSDGALFEKFGRGSMASRRHGLAILWLVAGAFRFNELASLKYMQVDWSGGTVQIQRSKRGLSPIRSIDRNLIEATLAWRKRFAIRSDLLLPTQFNTELSVNVFNRDVMRPLGSIFGCKLTSHSMRDTASQELLRIAESQGLGIKAVQASLGHRNLNSTETYLRKQEVQAIQLDLTTIGAIE